jgi:SnoaL-like domain
MPVKVPPPVDKLVEAINGGDTEAFLAFFSPNGAVEDWGRRFEGRAAIRRWSDKELIGAKGVMTVTKASVRGSKITMDADWKSNFYTGSGRFTFTIEGDKISEMRISEP